MKTLKNQSDVDTRQNVKDVEVYGNGSLFVLLAKASSEAEGWMKSTRAMEVPGGCVVQTTMQQRNPDGSYSIADALTFVPSVRIVEDIEHGGRELG